MVEYEDTVLPTKEQQTHGIKKQQPLRSAKNKTTMHIILFQPVVCNTSRGTYQNHNQLESHCGRQLPVSS